MTQPTTTPTRPDRSSQGRRRAVRALRWAGAVGGLAQSLAGAGGALLVRDVTGRHDVAGWPQAALVVGAACAALLLARLTRRHGRRTALATGAAVAAVGAVVVAGSGVLGSLVGILVGSVLLGAGNTAVMLGRYAAADLASPATKARAMGWVLAATSVGAVVGPNLLSPASALGQSVGLPQLTGAYLVAAVGFGLTSLVLARGLQGVFVRRALGRESQETRAGRRAALDRDGLVAIAILACANLVMVTVMTMAPVHLDHHGMTLSGIGMVVSLHIAGMFAPAPLSGWAADRFGPRTVVVVGGAVLATGSMLAGLSRTTMPPLVVGLVLLGVGWNLALVAGSSLLTTGASHADRPTREGWGEVGMGAAAAFGGLVSGLVVELAGYSTLATAGAVTSLLLLPLAGVRRHGPTADSPTAQDLRRSATEAPCGVGR